MWILFWQFYLAVTFSYIVGVTYLFKNDKDGQYLKHLNSEIYDYKDIMPNWLIMLSTVIGCLLWPFTIIEGIFKSSSEDEKIYQEHPAFDELEEKATKVQKQFLILELIIILLTRYFLA